MFDYAAYAQKLREEIHEYPELGYDLEHTLSVVHRELDAMGIEYTDKYCKSSVVGYINPGKAFTIGMRADMDALPIQEEVDLPFKSKNDGKMHACGHDAHTAILLAAAKALKEKENELNCTVKLIFSPAEEYIDPGCKHLAENGVMDDVDCAIAMHVGSDIPAGVILVNDAGGMNGNSAGFNIDFYGKASHAASQHKGKDAILMAVDAIIAMEFMVAKEVDGRKTKVLNFGAIRGGEVANVVCDHVHLKGTLRTWDDEVNDYILKRIDEICNGVAAQAGGTAKVDVYKYMPHVITHPVMQQRLRALAGRLAGGDDKVVRRERTMGGEDFAFLSRKKPCGHFKVGVKSAYKEKNVGHNGTFEVDNAVFKPAVDMFVNFILENQNGIEF